MSKVWGISARKGALGMRAPAGSEYEGPRGDRSDAVRVWLLGGFRVSVGPRTIAQDAWRLRKATTLVKLLALAPGHRLHREHIMDLLWPDLIVIGGGTSKKSEKFLPQLTARTKIVPAEMLNEAGIAGAALAGIPTEATVEAAE